MEPKRARTSVWRQACRDVASTILNECGIVRPPVNALVIARTLGLQLAGHAGQAGRFRMHRFGGVATRRLGPHERPERDQWRLAQEIGDYSAWQVFDAAGLDPREPCERQRNQVVNALACSLLLPDEWFERDADFLDGDVLRLKLIYTTVSHELILMNLLRLPRLSLISVLDAGRLLWRYGNGQLPPPPLLPLERRLWRSARESGQPAQARGQRVRVQCWPVSEAGQRRVLMRTTAIEGIDETPLAHDDVDECHVSECELAHAE